MNDVWPDTYNKGYVYISIPTWTHAQDSLAAAKALNLKIFFHGTSHKWSQRPSQSAKE